MNQIFLTVDMTILRQGLAFSINGAESLMRRARALVGHFNSSSQASESLAAVQIRGTGNKPKKIINDCPTRWWSTWKFAKRLVELKSYFSILVEEGAIDEDLNLHRDEWDMLEDIEELLEPFMLIQRVLEGQEYVTLSFVPHLITAVRKLLESKMVNARSEAVKNLARDMLSHEVKGFDKYWGSGVENTLFDENESVGRSNRQKGFPRNTLLAAFLDPRTKSLRSFGVADKLKIHNHVKMQMQKLIEEKEASSPITIDVPIVIPKSSNIPLSDLFDGMGDDENDADDQVPLSDHRITLELEFYKTAKGLPVMLPGGALSNPLSWWQMHEKVLPMLSTLAKRILCVPATSAPSERVFSVAGLTISKCRTSIQPQHASDIIFLHDSWALALECETDQNKK